jgi:restriction system protein
MVFDVLIWAMIFSGIVLVLVFLRNAFESLIYGLAYAIKRIFFSEDNRTTAKRGTRKKTASKGSKAKFNDHDFPWHNPKFALKVIDRMSGREFEKFLEKLFQKLGYQTILTPEMKDHGADLIIIDTRGRKFAIQAKKLQEYGRIGVSVLGEVTRGQRWYECHGSIVITNQHFTDQMLEEAKKLHVALWDRTDLSNLIRKAHKAN